MNGLDTASDVRPHLDCIKAAGIQWVGRYLASHTAIPGKILTPIEAQAISSAGLSIVSIWENGSPTSASYFSSVRGLADGDYASTLANVLGQPEESVIYATVDYDASAQDIDGPITDYLAAFASMLGTYQVGIYGSGQVCRVFKDDTLVTATWLSEASGWAEYTRYKGLGTWSILQSDGTVCGLPGDVTDLDQGQGNFGSWTRASTIT